MFRIVLFFLIMAISSYGLTINFNKKKYVYLPNYIKGKVYVNSSKSVYKSFNLPYTGNKCFIIHKYLICDFKKNKNFILLINKVNSIGQTEIQKINIEFCNRLQKNNTNFFNELQKKRLKIIGKIFKNKKRKNFTQLSDKEKNFINLFVYFSNISFFNNLNIYKTKPFFKIEIFNIMNFHSLPLVSFSKVFWILPKKFSDFSFIKNEDFLNPIMLKIMYKNLENSWSSQIKSIYKN